MESSFSVKADAMNKISSRMNQTDFRFSKGFALVSKKIILENNNCAFNDEFYRHISAIAMVTIFAPTLTMGYFEFHFYICELKRWKKINNLSLKNGYFY